MRLVILLAFFSIWISKIVVGQNTKDSVFILDESMIQYFDTFSGKLKLTEKAKRELSSIDFSKYSFLSVPHTSTLIIVLPWATAVRPLNILVYRNEGNSIVDDDGIIRIVSDHLHPADIRVIQLKKFKK